RRPLEVRGQRITEAVIPFVEHAQRVAKPEPVEPRAYVAAEACEIARVVRVGRIPMPGEEIERQMLLAHEPEEAVAVGRGLVRLCERRTADEGGRIGVLDGACELCIKRVELLRRAAPKERTEVGL